MSHKLVEITDKVLKEVIKNEVILPSTYKEHFDNHAREMQIDVDYEEMVDKATQKRLNEANALVEKTYCSLDDLEKTTAVAQEAIKEQDLDKLAMVFKEITALKNSVKGLKDQLHMDTLTKIYNRKWMMEHILDDGLFPFEGVLIFIDLDKFKPINDTHGHVIGDKVLQYLATYLKTSLKKMDVIRYAGDEFIAISKDQNMEECYKQLKLVQENLFSKKLKATNGELLYLSFSFGVTRFEIGSNYRDTLEIADSLMYENKKHKPK